MVDKEFIIELLFIYRIRYLPRYCLRWSMKLMIYISSSIYLPSGNPRKKSYDVRQNIIVHLNTYSPYCPATAAECLTRIDNRLAILPDYP